jgi:hypothetical protein
MEVNNMSKLTIKLGMAIAGSMFLAGSVSAVPITLSTTQLDAVAAGGVERVDGFVCPVISTNAVLNSPNGAAIAGGDYTIIGPDVSIPVHATNGDGAGSPGGAHSSPGDTDYTAIWAR